MSIRSAIDKTARTASLIYTQSPQYQQKMLQKRIQQKNLLKQMELANKRVQEQKEAKKVQRRNFMDYLRKMPSMGGTVGDLPTEMQKQIAKTYTKYERKKIMDEEDRKRGVSKRKESK